MSIDIFDEFKICERSKAVTTIVTKIGSEKWKETPRRKKTAKISGELRKRRIKDRNEVRLINIEYSAICRR
jgi:hypothetical protein